MKNTLLFWIFISFINPLSAQLKEIGFSNSKMLSKATELYGNRIIKTDINNNIYIAGFFSGTMSIDSFSISLSLSTSNAKGLFIAKYDENKNLIWLRKIFEADSADRFEIVIDSSNNYYCAISYIGKIYSESDSFVSFGDFDLKLSKFDSSGSLIFTKNIGGIEPEYIYKNCLALDDSNNLYMTMGVNNKLEGTPQNNYNFTIDSQSLLLHNADIILSKFDENGNLFWMKRYGGKGPDRGSSIIIANNNVYMMGLLGAQRDTIGNVYLDYINYYTSYCFFAKLDLDGNGIWARKFGANVFGSVVPSSIAVSGNKVFVAGGGFATISGMQFLMDGGPMLIGMNDVDYFIAAYDTNGNFEWSKISNTIGSEYLSKLISDSANNLYASGVFEYSIKLPFDTIINHGGEDAFIISYDSNGNYRFGASAGGWSIERADDMELSANGKIHLVGVLSSPECYFGNDTLIPPTPAPYIWVSTIDSILIPQTPNAISTAVKPVSFTMYPNPASNVVNLLFDAPQYNASITITNTIGQKVYSGVFNTTNNQYKLQLPQLANGVYVVNVGGRNLQLVVIDLQ